jgi:uncharacterized membrane protein
MFGLDLHPSVIHFPIALTVVGAAAEVAYVVIRRSWLRWFGPILLTLALLGAGGAYFSGTAVEDKAERQGVPEAAVDEHEEAALWAIGCIALATLLSWATRPRGKGLWIPALFALIAAGAVLRTGHLGGRLVFVHGAGHVSAAPGGPGQPAAKGESVEEERSEHERK